MEYGICEQALVSVRVQPGDQQEMVNQLLFGDLVMIKGQIQDWLLIETIDDQYEGWIDKKQILLISKDEFNQLSLAERNYSLSLSEWIVSNEKQLKSCITLGAMLPQYEHGTFKIAGQSYPYAGEILSPNMKDKGSQLVHLAQMYLGSPYLWGGRSPFGIDCSGLVQIVFKMCGILLPRDAAEQVKVGETVNFISEGRQADLVFFGNEDGNIIHVGILLNSSTVIHASGKVRIDQIDHQGIYNAEQKKYTHQLRIIKRIC